MSKILMVPLDGSTVSEQALPWALELAEKLPADIILLRVGREPGVFEAQDLLTLEAFAKRQEETCRNYLLGVKLRLETETSAKILVEYSSGFASEVILEQASELHADLIVMNSHGRDGVARWWMGSVAEKVTRHAPCPVFLVRQANADEQVKVADRLATETAG